MNRTFLTLALVLLLNTGGLAEPQESLVGDATVATGKVTTQPKLNSGQVGDLTTPLVAGQTWYQKKRCQALMGSGALVVLVTLLSVGWSNWNEPWISATTQAQNAIIKLSSTTKSAVIGQMRTFLIAGLAAVVVIVVIGGAFLVYRKCVTKQDSKRAKKVDVEAAKQNANRLSSQPSSNVSLAGSTAPQKTTSNINSAPTYLSTGFTACSTQSSDSLPLPTYVTKLCATFKKPGPGSKLSSTFSKHPPSKNSTNVQKNLNVLSKTPK